MVVGITSVGSRGVLTPVGELDLFTLPTLSEAIHAVIRTGEREVWVDLSHVAFIDAGTVATLITAGETLARDQRRLTVIAPPGEAPRRTIDSFGAGSVLAVQASRSSAHRNR